MAKQKLTKAAIGFIIEKKNDWNVNYTFADIAELLKEGFGITITEQGVSKSYRKYKDDEELQKLLAAANNKNIRKVKKVRDRTNDNLENPTTIKDPRDFDEDAGKDYDVNDFFIK